MTLAELESLVLAATPPCANCCVRLDCFCHCCALADAMTTERILALLAVVKAAKALEAEASKRLRFRDAERYPELCAALTAVRTALAALEQK